MDWKITGNHCLLFDLKKGEIGTIDGYRKEILKEFSKVRNLISSLKSPWVETIKIRQYMEL